MPLTRYAQTHGAKALSLPFIQSRARIALSRVLFSLRWTMSKGSVILQESRLTQTCSMVANLNLISTRVFLTAFQTGDSVWDKVQALHGFAS